MAPPSPGQLWATIRRARLIQVLVVYLGASFVVLEAIDVLTDQLGLPDWVFPGAVVLLLIGLPIIMATAIVQGIHAAAPESGTDGLPPDETAEEGAARTAAPAPSAPAPAAPRPAIEIPAAARHWLTWQKALLGGVLAFALLGLAVTAYTAMRVMGIGPVGSLVAAGAIEEGERTVLADFQSQTGDSVLAAAVTEAFRIDIAQSQLISIVPPNQISGVLRRMERDADESLDVELAREVAIREGFKAVIGGAINAAGGGYVLSAQLIGSESGAELAAFRVTADDSTEIIGSIDDLSKKMRERIGESVKTIRANEPLETVTTSSLKALRLYSRALRALEEEGDLETGIALLEEAVALDSTFAMAWRKLGIALGRRGGEWARELAAYEKAVDLRDRLTDRERYTALGTYYSEIDDREKAIAAYRSLLDLYPDDVTGLNNLSVLYTSQRDYEKALELRLRAAALEPANWLFYSNATHSAISLGDWERADSILEALAKALPAHPQVQWLRAWQAYVRGEYDTAEAHLLALRETEGSAFWQAQTSDFLATIRQIRGQLASAERHSRDGAATNEQRGLVDARRDLALYSAFLDLWFRDDTTSAVRKLEEALERYPLEMQQALDRPYLSLAWFYGWADDPDRARGYLRQWEAEIDPVIRRGIDFRHGVRGAIALAEGRHAEAIENMRAWDGRLGCPICALPLLALTYDRAGVQDSALALYERFVTTPYSSRTIHPWTLPGALERLGELYEQRGNVEKAIYYYGRFAELWKDADLELQPRVVAARRAITALSSDK